MVRHHMHLPMPKLSRRDFLLSGVSFAIGSEIFLPADARKLRSPAAKSGPHAIAMQAWPPAIAPDHAAVLSNGICCLTDEFGHLAVVDFRKQGDTKVVGELAGLGKKVVDVAFLAHRAYAIVLSESEGAEAQYMLVAISLAPQDEPSIIFQSPIEHITEPTCITAYQDLVAVGGTGQGDNNLIGIFGIGSKRGKSLMPEMLSTISVDAPPVRLDLLEKNLLSLGSGHGGSQGSQIDCINLFVPHSPQLRKSVKLDGDYAALARSKDFAVAAGKTADASGCQLTLVSLDMQPHVVETHKLEGMTDIYDIALGRGYSAILGGRNGDLLFVPFSISKTLDVATDAPVALPISVKSSGPPPRLALKDRFACVAAGAGAAEILTFENKVGWKHEFTYSIPHLPASGVASWGDLVMLAAADLKVYDITKPSNPQLLKTAPLTGAVKSIAGAGSFVLCLSKDDVSLRRLDSPGEVVTQAQVTGQHVCFDNHSQKAYVVSALGKKASVYPLSVYSNRLDQGETLSLDQPFHRACAQGGYLMLAGLNDIALYEMGDTPQLIGSRHFDNLAIRDIAIADDCLIASAVDHNSKGFFLVLAKEGKELNMLGSTNLAHDGRAMACAGQTAVCVGSAPDGKDMASILHFSEPALPNEISTFPVIEAASAVTIKDQLAIIVGRGLEIVSLS